MTRRLRVNLMVIGIVSALALVAVAIALWLGVDHSRISPAFLAIGSAMAAILIAAELRTLRKA